MRIEAAAGAAVALVGTLQDALRDEAAEILARRTADACDVVDAIEAAKDGFARLAWAACGPAGERRLNEAGVSVRCVQTADGAIPEDLARDDLVAIVARAY